MPKPCRDVTLSVMRRQVECEKDWRADALYQQLEEDFATRGWDLNKHPTKTILAFLTSRIEHALLLAEQDTFRKASAVVAVALSGCSDGTALAYLHRVRETFVAADGARKRHIKKKLKLFGPSSKRTDLPYGKAHVKAR